MYRDNNFYKRFESEYGLGSEYALPIGDRGTGLPNLHPNEKRMAAIKILTSIAGLFGIGGTILLGIIGKIFRLLDVGQLEVWKVNLLFLLSCVSCLFYIIMQGQRIIRNQRKDRLDNKRAELELKREIENLKKQQQANDPNY